MLRPLPFGGSERFVHLWSKAPVSSVKQWVSYPDFSDWQRRSRAFEQMAAWTVIDGMTLIGSGEAERVEGVSVFGNFFQILGTSPLVGTIFPQESELQEANAVLGYGLWQRRFGSDPGVVGTEYHSRWS
jgi:hypothetical protein